MLAKGSIQISTEKTESHNMVNGFLKGAKASQQRRYSFFQQMVLKKLDTHMLKKKWIDSHLIPQKLTQMNYRPKLKPKTSMRKHQENLCDLGLGKNVFDTKPKAWIIKGKKKKQYTKCHQNKNSLQKTMLR